MFFAAPAVLEGATGKFVAWRTTLGTEAAIPAPHVSFSHEENFYCQTRCFRVDW